MTTNEPDEGGIPAPSAEFVQNVSRMQQRLHAFILSLVRHRADADDVLQETNLVLWRKSADFDPGTSFDAWAFRVAHFQVMAYRKRRQRSKLSFDDELVQLLAVEGIAEVRDSAGAMVRALDGCLKKLRDEDRRLVAQRYAPGGCVASMAATRKMTPKALSERLRRIRRALMHCIERRMEIEEAAEA